MTIVQGSTSTDFSALLSKSKNFRPADVTRIVPRDAFKARERRDKNDSCDAKKDDTNTMKRVVYEVNEDGISRLSDIRASAILDGNKECNEPTSCSDISSTKECDYYIIGDDDENVPFGYSKEEFLIEKAFSSQTNKSIGYLQCHRTTKTDADESNCSDRKSVEPELSDIFLSKNPLLHQDQIDIEATALDLAKVQKANQLAVELSLRTAACLNIDLNQSISKPRPLQLLDERSKIMVKTMSHEERSRLEARRKREEQMLPYNLHGIELLGWESKINWEGAEDDVCAEANQDKNVASHDTSYPDPHQILSQTFNTTFEGMDLSKLISWEGADAAPGVNEALGRQIGKLVLQDKVAAMSVVRTSAMKNSNPRPFNQSEEFKNRMESKVSSSGPVSSLHTDMAKKNKEIEARQKKRAQREIDKTKRIKDVLVSVGALDGGTGRAITSSLMGPGGTERTGRPMRHHGSSLAHDFEYIDQLDMINNHSLVKPDMSPVELRHYCRPLLPRFFFRPDENMPWQLQIVVSPSQKSNGKTGKGPTYQSSMVNVMPGSISQSKIRNVTDLCPSEGSLVLIEYSEEKPPIKLMKGMASKIVNYYKGDKSKCPISAGGGDRPIKKKKHGLLNQDSDIKGSSGKVEKPPRLEGPDLTALSIKDLIGKIGQKKHGDGNNPISSSVKIHPEGVTEILKDHGPFLGKVMDGTTQTGLVNNLFVAPMQRHDPKPTDFLMILGKTKHQAASNARISVVLRPMPKNCFIAGQNEPKRKVFAPDSKGDKDFVGPFTTYQIAKALQSKHAKEKCGLRFEEIKEGLFPYMEIPSNPLRQRIKKVAAYDKNTQIWTLKPAGVEDFEGIESLSRSIQPEGVAAHWSARWAEQYLSDVGLQQVSLMCSSVVNIGIAMTYLNGDVNAAGRRRKTMIKLAKSHSKSKDHDLFLKAKEKLTNEFKNIQHKAKVANFIYEELQLTPWNLTTDFMDVHRNPQGTGTMKLTGIGDPSGVSAGFNFMRETDKPNKSSTKNDNKNKEEITGTDKDLRKLSMTEMARILKEEYDVPQKDINNLGRWDRVHLIREFSTKGASDNAGDGMERYARGEKIKLRDKIDSYKKRIQEIWERQKSFLQEVEEESPLEKTSEALLKEDNSASDDDDDDENDDDDEEEEDNYVALLQKKMQDSKKRNELIRKSEDSKPSKDIAEDAGDLAELIREQKEGQAFKTPSDDKPKHGTKYARNRFHGDKKVIRRKVTRTRPDGTQTTVFKFIVDCDDEVIANVSKQMKTKKANNWSFGTKKKSKGTQVGHDMFEEDETSIKMIQVKRKTGRGRGRRNDGDYVPPKTKKISGSQSKPKQKQEKKKQKRKREEDEEDIYYSHARRKGTNNRKVRGSARELKPHAKLADRLEEIRSDCEKRPGSGAFHRPVNRTQFPTYYETISNPIDLQTIRDKIQRYEYRAADAFIRDFEVMKNNAIKFNGFGHKIGIEATNIFNFVKSTIEANRAEFTSIEIAVDEQFNSGSKKRSRSTTPKFDKVETSGNPANVTLNGVQTKVYLGDLQGPFSDLG